VSIRAGALREEITVFTRVASGTDEYNNTIFADSPGVTVRAAVAPIGAAGGIGSSEEIEGDRDTRLSRYLMMVQPETDLTGLDRVEWRGRSFEIHGEPREFTVFGNLHHKEFTAREILG
jgi:hypothetical protein